MFILVDHSRVRLHTDSDASDKSGYINASYIHSDQSSGGGDKSKAYIAAQGTRRHSVSSCELASGFRSRRAKSFANSSWFLHC